MIRHIDRTDLLIVVVAMLLLACSARAQQIITLPAGPLARQDFQPGRVYVGNGTIIRTQRGNPSKILGSNVTIRGVRFEGDGLRRDGLHDGLIVEDCEFVDCRVGVEVNAGFNVTIRRNLFERCSFAAWLSDQRQLLIERNEVRNCGYGFKAFGDSAGNRSWIAKHNWIHDCGPDFMAIEWQGVCSDWLIEGNLIERIAVGPAASDNDHSLLLSAPMDRGVRGVIRSNAVLGRQPRGQGWPAQWESGIPALIEAGGDQTLIEGNILDGGGVGITITDRVGSCDVTLRNNLITRVFAVWNRNAGQTVRLEGANGPGASVPMTVDQIRQMAGRAQPPATGPATAPAADPIVEIVIRRGSGRTERIVP